MPFGGYRSKGYDERQRDRKRGKYKTSRHRNALLPQGRPLTVSLSQDRLISSVVLGTQSE
jgi:hypothetical protein